MTLLGHITGELSVYATERRSTSTPCEQRAALCGSPTDRERMPVSENGVPLSVRASGWNYEQYSIGAQDCGPRSMPAGTSQATANSEFPATQHRRPRPANRIDDASGRESVVARARLSITLRYAGTS
jgi:hypothetical protein